MTALAADRLTSKRAGEQHYFPVLAGAKIYAGAIVVLDASGWAKPGVTATGLICVGRAETQVDNTNGQNGDLSVEVRKGVFHWVNGEAITKAAIGDTAYIIDDQTIGSTGTGKSPAGIIDDVDSTGVYVSVFQATQLATTGLLAANNLSDVGTAATARANIGSNKQYLTLQIPDLVGGDAKVYRIASPIAGTITNIRSSLQLATLTTGNATLTGKIAGAAITTGVLTLVQAGSALGDSVTVTPSGANTVVAGSDINFTVGGTQASTVAGATLTIEITY